MKIVVLMGGNSSEREVSLSSGQAVAKGLRESGHEVEVVDIRSVAEVTRLPELAIADMVFPALHGGQGEDGHLQALLEVMEIPFALSGHTASALAMDKGSAKRIMRAAGIPTPDWLQITTPLGRGLSIEHIKERCHNELGFPVVVKLNGSGSSVGVEIVKEAGQFESVFTRIAKLGEQEKLDVLIEKFIPGRELTATIFLGRRLPLLEIRPREGFYDYENKYTEGANEYLVPAPVHSPVYENISADALRVFELIGCQGVARADFRLDGDDYYCLEINTIPGMTENSLVPKAAAAVGISFSALVDDLCRSVGEGG